MVQSLNREVGSFQLINKFLYVKEPQPFEA
jgi:hypothetical protein